ncbi:MAG: hypothetical protein JSV78_13020 [Phycisphaerales bacterium]|nr:MAG: hypothetical protein JSV78_13020 [Phycisphaerales bacterium]
MMSSFHVRIAAILCIAGTLLGCGSSIMNPLSLPNRLYGKDGQVFYLDDLEDIANDPTLTEEQKKQAFRDLGIQDERLVEALLDL